MQDEELLALIRNNFPPHPLNSERAFEGGRGSYLNADEFKRDSQGLSWDQLTFEFLRFHYDCLPQLSPAAFAEYLPAFLAIIISHRAVVDIMPWALLAAITPSADYPDSAAHCVKRINALMRGQMLTTMEVFGQFLEAETDEADKKRIQKALHGFRSSYIDERSSI